MLGTYLHFYPTETIYLISKIYLTNVSYTSNHRVLTYFINRIYLTIASHTSSQRVLTYLKGLTAYIYQVLCSVLKANLSCQLNPHKLWSAIISKDDSFVDRIADSQLHALVGYMVILDNNIHLVYTVMLLLLWYT